MLTEEVLGLEKCVVTVDNLLSLTEDIDRFSAPDNYWCYCFERAVSKYVNRSSNKQNIECTYANAECHWETNSLISRTNSNHFQKFLKEDW